jgi:hypothetical protein
MGKKRIIIILFLIILGILGTLAIDLILTSRAITGEDGFEVENVDAKASDDHLTMELTISLRTKSGGVLEKICLLNLELTDVRVNRTITSTFEFTLGSRETKSNTLNLDPAQTAALNAYPFLGFEVKATFSVGVLGIEIPASYPVSINPILLAG